jgi:hypothetical protein
MQPIGYYNRFTALSIVEPWVAYRMEHASAPVDLARSLSQKAINKRLNQRSQL